MAIAYEDLIVDVLNEMSLPHYLFDDIEDLFNDVKKKLSTFNDDINFFRAITFLVAIKHKMMPDIDYLYEKLRSTDYSYKNIDHNIASNMRNIISSLQDQFDFLKNRIYTEPVVDEQLGNYIRKLYEIIDEAIDKKFFIDYSSLKVEKHIIANTFKIGLILSNFTPSRWGRSHINNIFPEKYNDIFLGQMALILFANAIVVYDNSHFDIFNKDKYVMDESIDESTLLMIESIWEHRELFPFFHVYSTFENYMTPIEEITYRNYIHPNYHWFKHEVRKSLYMAIRQMIFYDNRTIPFFTDDLLIKIMKEIKLIIENVRYETISLNDIVRGIVLINCNLIADQENMQLHPHTRVLIVSPKTLIKIEKIYNNVRNQ